MNDINRIINLKKYPINDLKGFASDCYSKLNKHGSIVLPDFICKNIA